MSSIRVRIEKSLETFAHFIYQHRYKTLFVMVVLVAALASQLPRIETDTSTEGFLRKNDPTRMAYDKFRRQFGRDELISPGHLRDHVADGLVICQSFVAGRFGRFGREDLLFHVVRDVIVRHCRRCPFGVE